MTEGVLLRMLSSDETLRQYDAIVLDEVRHGLTVPTLLLWRHLPRTMYPRT